MKRQLTSCVFTSLPLGVWGEAPRVYKVLVKSEIAHSLLCQGRDVRSAFAQLSLWVAEFPNAPAAALEKLAADEGSTTDTQKQWFG